MTTAKIRSFQPNGYQETIKKGLSAIHNFNSGMSLASYVRKSTLASKTTVFI